MKIPTNPKAIDSAMRRGSKNLGTREVVSRGVPFNMLLR
jgi:hypothetical protein